MMITPTDIRVTEYRRQDLLAAADRRRLMSEESWDADQPTDHPRQVLPAVPDRLQSVRIAARYAHYFPRSLSAFVFGVTPGR